MRVVDLDGVATAPPLPEVAAAMEPFLGSLHANPESSHARGARAARALECARVEVAALVGAEPESVVFTSGATEANNTAMRGAASLARRLGRSLVAVPAHEHASLLHPARSLAGSGCTLEALRVGPTGLVAAAVLPDLPLGVLALAHGHAELGALQPATELARSARQRGARVVIDAALTAGRMPVDLASLGRPHVLTLSFHHMGGPAGVGALVLGECEPVPPLLEGGAQERGIRAGMPNLAGCVGAGVAARVARERVPERAVRLRRLAALLREGVLGAPGVRPTGPDPAHRIPGHVSVIVAGVDGEALVAALEQRHVLASTASPCAGRAGVPSASLLGAGYSRSEARSSVVLCVPPTGTPSEEDVRAAGRRFRDAVSSLRAVSGAMARRQGRGYTATGSRTPPGNEVSE